MKEIKLTRGFVAQVDDEDYEYLNQFHWYPQKGHNTYYAKRKIFHNGTQDTILMHRDIMNTPKDMEVDHRDHDGLNNQKSNLRNCTHRQNQINKIVISSSPYRGVTWVLKRKKWKIKARIKVYGRGIHLGYFRTEEMAALAYNEAAKKYFGEFAVLNII